MPYQGCIQVVSSYLRDNAAKVGKFSWLYLNIFCTLADLFVCLHFKFCVPAFQLAKRLQVCGLCQGVGCCCVSAFLLKVGAANEASKYGFVRKMSP